MIELLYGLALSLAGFVSIMALIIVMGRSIGRFFGPKEDQ